MLPAAEDATLILHLNYVASLKQRDRSYPAETVW
jgi:hypothetical protein